MNMAYPIRNFLNEIVVAADAASFRIRARPFLPSDSQATGDCDGQERSRVLVALPAQASTAARWIGAANLKQKLLAYRKALVVSASLLVAPAIGLTATWMAYWPELQDLRAQMEGISVSDASGVNGGALTRASSLMTLDGAGQLQPRITITAAEVPKDFLIASRTLEGEGLLGVNPVNLARGLACLGVAGIGVKDFGWLRLNGGQCAGGSTLAMQSVRALTDDNAYSGSRKLDEVLRAIALNVNFLGDQEGYDRFVVDTQHFGYARGKPLYGIRSSSLAMFGKEPADLQLHENLMLAAALLKTVGLDCASASPTRLARFNAIKARAIYALDRGFRDDPRYETVRRTLQNYPPLTMPAAAPAALSIGLSADTACRAGAHPLLQFEAIDSSARLAAQAELAELEAIGIDVREVRLSTDFARQMQFKQQIDNSRELVARSQRGQWIKDPTEDGVVVLAFTTAANGELSALYESTSFSQLNRERDLGSIAKLPALLFLAEQGWAPNLAFCNKASPPLRNAGGDRGVPSCADQRGKMPAEEVFGRSVSLAVLEALRRYPAAMLRQRMMGLGIMIPEGLEPAYAVAFGLARTTPARMSAIVGAMSAGLVGNEPIGSEPSIIREYRAADGHWHKPVAVRIDLSRAFSTPLGRDLIADAASAAYGSNGTLARLGPALEGAVGKSGTLDDNHESVRFKGATGGLGGRSWFVMAVPDKGALGHSGIGIMPIAQTARDFMLSGTE